jgi:beta-lactamase class A
MADKLMSTILGSTTGPLMVTEDMQTLGLDNTFLGGYFYPGAPLMQRFQTPANQRTDISTDPDVYNQTTPTDMGMLLEDIYFCAEKGGGTFEAAFPGQISQAECKQMIAYLSKNRNGVLLEAGLPEATQVAHKHGWVIESDNLMHTISDAGIVFSAGGNYIISVYMHDPQQLLWDSANLMVSKLSQAVYNYFNQTGQ